MFRVVSILLLMAVGVGVGWWVRTLPVTSVPQEEVSMEGATSSAADGETVSVVQPKELPGYCCTNEGDACVASPDPVTCMRGGGILFNIKEATCSRICRSAAQ